MKKVQFTILFLAASFCFTKTNAQKIDLATLENLAANISTIDGALTNLGFDDANNYAKGKDSAQITYEVHNTTILDFCTNNSTLNDQILADIKKNYTKDNESAGQYEKKGYTIYYLSGANNAGYPFKYDFKVQYFGQ